MKSNKISLIENKTPSRIALIVFVIIFGYLSGAARNVCSDKALNAIKSKDLSVLHLIYNSESPSQRSAIENALYGALINLDDLTYEQLVAGDFGTDDMFDKIISRHLSAKEAEITKIISLMSAEEIGEYVTQYPQRDKVVSSYLTSVVFENLDSISYRELEYLNRKLQYPEIKETFSARSGERHLMVRDAIRDYCSIEAQYSQLLNDLIRIAAFQYLNAQFSNIASSYSLIDIVPDSPQEIDRQIKQIVYNCFSAKDFKKSLNVIVAKYCKAINSARGKYAEAANIKGYPLMSIIISDIKDITFTNDPVTLSKIPKARQDFIDSREAAGAVASIASCFVGRIISTVGKGLYDIYAVEELADQEVTLRKELLKSGTLKFKVRYRVMSHLFRHQ